MKIIEAKMDFDLHTLYVRFDNSPDVAAAFKMLSRPPRKLSATTAYKRELIELLRAGRVIDAIKRHRDVTKLGLKEAKDYVDTLRAEAGL